jgi:hypothetical protein
MRNDVKIRRLVKRYGLEGYGLYNLIIETIAESLSTDNPVPELEETAQDIAEQYNGDTAKINDMMSFMLNQGLFEVDEMTGRILCQKMYKFLDKSQTRSEEIRKMIDSYKMSQCPRQIETVSNIPDRREEKRIDKEEKREDKKTRFAPHSPQSDKEYLNEQNIKSFTSTQFIDYYEARGWMIGKNKMKDWKAAVRTWKNRETKEAAKPSMYNKLTTDIEQ